MEQVVHSFLVLLRVGLDILCRLELSVVVGSEGSEEVSVSHDKGAVLLLDRGERLEYLLGGREESYLVFVVATDAVTSAGVAAAISFLVLRGEEEGQGRGRSQPPQPRILVLSGIPLSGEVGMCHRDGSSAGVSGGETVSSESSA